MKRSIFALLLAVLMILTACGGPGKKAEAVPAESPAPAPVETAPPTAAPTEAPTPEPVAEYELPREAGCHQLSIYWTKDAMDLDTSDMWIWFKNMEGRGYLMHPCAYGAKVVVNVPENVEEVGFIVRTNCSDPGGTSWGSADKDYDGDRFVKMEGSDKAVYLKSGDETIYYSEDGGVTLKQKVSIKFAGISG